jgi:hypothetical protein
MREKILIAIIGAVVGGIITAAATTILRSPPQVATYDAQTFFHYYYRAVTQDNQRSVLYSRYLSPDFRNSPGHSWRSYQSFWDGITHVEVDDVASIPDNPWAFKVTLVFFKRNGNISQPENTIFSLICTGTASWLYTRIPSFGCPWNQIQIESGYDISGSSP